MSYRRDENPLDELGNIKAHLSVLSDLVNPEPDLHCVSRNDLAVVLNELESRLSSVVDELHETRRKKVARALRIRNENAL